MVRFLLSASFVLSFELRPLLNYLRSEHHTFNLFWRYLTLEPVTTDVLNHSTINRASNYQKSVLKDGPRFSLRLCANKYFLAFYSLVLLVFFSSSSTYLNFFINLGCINFFLILIILFTSANYL